MELLQRYVHEDDVREWQADEREWQTRVGAATAEAAAAAGMIMSPPPARADPGDREEKIVQDEAETEMYTGVAARRKARLPTVQERTSLWVGFCHGSSAHRRTQWAKQSLQS